MGGDGEYFEDSCYQFQDRLDKSYSPEFRYLSSWRCNRIVEIPKKALGKPGAFVLIAEANGQQAYVPILFDPLSLTMRRCRDGVFVMVSDPLGSDPIAGATIHADQMLGTAKTDKQGVAFAQSARDGLPGDCRSIQRSIWDWRLRCRVCGDLRVGSGPRQAIAGSKDWMNANRATTVRTTGPHLRQSLRDGRVYRSPNVSTRSKSRVQVDRATIARRERH